MQCISDRGSDLQNEEVRTLREETNGEHYFTLAYCPWSNGTVQVVCCEVREAMCGLFSEFQLAQKSWPSVVPLGQSILKNAPLARLGNRCPLTVITGLPQDSPLLSIKTNSKGKTTIHTIREVSARQVIHTEQVQLAMEEEMHKYVAVLSSQKCQKEIRSTIHAQACVPST